MIISDYTFRDCGPQIMPILQEFTETRGFYVRIEVVEEALEGHQKYLHFLITHFQQELLPLEVSLSPAT